MKNHILLNDKKIGENNMVLHDNETAVDFLYYESIATTIKKMIDKTSKPITVGIHGDWGAGKSSILAMLEEAYSTDNSQILCLKFNGWLFQGFEDAKIVLLEAVIAELTNARSTSKKIKNLSKSLFKRINWIKASKISGQALFTYLAGMPSPDIVTQMSQSIKSIFENPSDQFTKENLEQIFTPFKDVINDTDKTNIPYEMHAFRREFEELLDEINITQLVVLIDDLDRCLPKTTIETLEALRLFLFVPKTAFIIAADEAMIEYAVKEHFPNLPNTIGATSYARNYLEKLIQIPFRIPALGSTETLTYVTLLLAMRSLDEQSEGFEKLKELSREAIQKPWIGNSLTLDVINSSIANTDEQQKAREALMLAQQISPMISEGTNGNPRQIKRFINSLMLRKQIAIARGFGSEINLNVLAKIMLAESFHTEFYKNLNYWVSNTTQGKAKEIHDLEYLELEPKKEFLKQEINSDWIIQWSELNPKLSDVDLRPYLFVTRDRKTKFGVIFQSDSIQELADKLMGSGMAVAGLKERVLQLSSQDVEKVYQYIEQALSNAGNLLDQPDGAEGMTLLIKSHKFLQNKYCLFLETLPVENIGTWVVIPIATFSEPPVQKQYQILLKKWQEQNENHMLSTFAGQILKSKKDK